MIVSSRSSHLWVRKYEERMQSNQVWAVGGGQVSEEGKHVAKHLDQPLYIVPTNLSCDAFFTGCIAVRLFSWEPPLYMPCHKPVEVIYDEDILSETPIRYNVAGWADILSALTAELTWRKEGTYRKEVAEKMAELMMRVCPPVTANNRKILFDTLKEEVDLCDQFGSSAPEEGMEHQVGYALERFNGEAKLLHGELVFIGINRILQVLDVQTMSRLEQIYKDLGVNVGDLESKIGVEVVKKTTEDVLKRYIK